MAIENDDPFSKLSEQGGISTNSEKKDESSDIDSLFGDTDASEQHSDNDKDEYVSGGHESSEKEDPAKDALSQYADSVGGWFGGEAGGNGGNNNSNTNTTANNNPQNNLNPIQKEQLRHQENMNRREEVNKGLETSKNMINTFQENAQTAMGFNPNAADIIKESQTELRDYLKIVNEELLDEQKLRKKSNPEDSDEIFVKLNWLKVKIVEDQKTYRKYEQSSRKWALTFRLMSSMLAAFVTVLLGLNITDYMKSLGIDWFVNFFALLISAFISIVGVIQGFFDVNELYIKYTDTANKLEQLQEMIEYLEMSKNYVTLRQTNLIYRAYTKILNSTHDYEMRIRAEGDDKKS